MLGVKYIFLLVYICRESFSICH